MNFNRVTIPTTVTPRSRRVVQPLSLFERGQGHELGELLDRPDVGEVHAPASGAQPPTIALCSGRAQSWVS